MSIQTVAITGGNGRIGGAIIEELNDHGYRTVNLNRGKAKNRVVEDAGEGADEYIQTQMLDPGNVYASLAKGDADAVVHMATIPNPLTTVDNQTYRSNVMSTYHVLEAASSLELEAAVLPSSVNVMGGPFQDAPMEVEYLPVDEAHPVTPRDPYATSKHAIEVTADGFGRQPRPPTTISCLRYPWVATTEELKQTFVERDRSPETLGREDTDFARDDLFSYLHVDDAARIARLALEADFNGHERFWAVAADTTSSAPTADVVETFYPDADVRRTFEGRESIVTREKARRLLDWEPTYTWA